MIIKDALPPVSLPSEPRIPTSTSFSTAGGHGRRRVKYRAYGDVGRSVCRPFNSRPSTASSWRSNGSPRVTRRDDRVISSPTSSSSSRSTSSSSSSTRVYTKRSRTDLPTRRVEYHLSTPTTPCSRISAGEKLISEKVSSKENSYSNGKRSFTSKDALIRLFEVWQPQLSPSYRSHVDYVPTGPLQMKAFINAMLLEPRSPYLDRFRAVGRVVTTINHLYPFFNPSETTIALHDLQKIVGGQDVESPTSEGLHVLSPSSSVPQSRIAEIGTFTDGVPGRQLLHLRHPNRPRSGHLQRQEQANVVLKRDPSSHQLLKSQSHAQFKL